MGANDMLILRAENLDTRLNELGEQLAADRSLRELYVQDPARIILKTVFPGQSVPAAEVNRGNRLLYALLSNESFTSWAEEYSGTLIAAATEATQETDPEKALREYLAITDRAKIHRDVADAVARSADAEIIAALTWRPDPESLGVNRVADVAVDIEILIYAVFLGINEISSVVTRVDVQRVAIQLAQRVAERGSELRAAEALVDFSRRNSGYTR